MDLLVKRSLDGWQILKYRKKEDWEGLPGKFHFIKGVEANFNICDICFLVSQIINIFVSTPHYYSLIKCVWPKNLKIEYHGAEIEGKQNFTKTEIWFDTLYDIGPPKSKLREPLFWSRRKPNWVLVCPYFYRVLFCFCFFVYNHNSWAFVKTIV